jgi:hypothetical protein
MKQTLIAFGLVGGLTAGLVALAIRGDASDSKRQTEEAPAVGFVATPAKWWDGEENQDGHTLTFAWVDGAGSVHPQTMEQISWYDPAKTYKVCYNPQDPKDHRLRPADHVCGS